MHAIEKELIKKLKVKPEEGEDRQEFLSRLVEGMEILDDDEWEKLSNGAKDWTNAATKAFKAKKKIADFADDDKDPKPARGGAAKPAAKTDAKKTSAEKPTGDSSMMFIRRHLADNPGASVDEVEEALKGAGIKVPSRVTISTVRSEFRSITKILREKGVFKQGVTLGS